ncbi:MAG: hypothetical protein KBS62_07600 [Oscillospiraceae bacterium]|nr:hypothetical protein [Candidatus Ruminococcus equi]
MFEKTFCTLERAGIFAVFAISVFLSFRVCAFTPSALEILFCSVNDSAWERTKAVICAYFIWWGLELLLLKLPFYRFVVAKTVSLYICILLMFAFHFIYLSTGGGDIKIADTVFSFFALSVSAFVTVRLTKVDKSGELFYPCVFLLMLMFVMFFCFSIFPPKMFLFKDYGAGIYGFLEKSVEASRILT